MSSFVCVCIYSDARSCSLVLRAVWGAGRRRGVSGLYLCIYVYLSIYIHIDLYLHVCVYIHTYIYIFIQISLAIRAVGGTGRRGGVSGNHVCIYICLLPSI